MATGDDTEKTIKTVDEKAAKLKAINDVQNKADEIPANVAQKICSGAAIATNEEKTKDLTESESTKGHWRKSEIDPVVINRVVKTYEDESNGSDSGVAVSSYSTGSRSKADTAETSLLRLEKDKRTKLGHRRVRSDGQVTYKNILTSKIISSIQLGIEHAIFGLTSKSERDLLMQDFMTVESTPFSSYAIPVQRNSRFVFKTYAPTAFRYFRELFGIRPEDFLTSFCQKPLKELSNSGNSGSIFYLTEDDKFIIKTMQSKECSFLQNLLPGYYMNLHQNPNTLLPKYFGLYCYQCDMKKIKMVAMNNILPSSIKISQRYDLKGATYKFRSTKPDTSDDSPSVYKDLDFMLHHPAGLYLESETYNALMKTIKRDCTVLESFKIMDYSLLLGISKVENSISTPRPNRKSSLFETKSNDNDEVLDSLSVKGAENKGDVIDKWKASLSDLKRPSTPDSRTATDSTARPGDDRWLGLYKTDTFPHGGIPVINGEGEPLLIFIGIIDILQSYKLKKKIEHAWKSVIHNGDTVSVHKPAFYSARFQKFMAEKVFKKISPSIKRKYTKQNNARSPTTSIGKPRNLSHFNTTNVCNKLLTLGNSLQSAVTYTQPENRNSDSKEEICKEK